MLRDHKITDDVEKVKHYTDIDPYENVDISDYSILQVYTEAIAPVVSGMASIFEISPDILDFKAREGMTTILRERLLILRRRAQHYTPLNRLLSGSLPPPIDRRKLRGILAFREWTGEDELKPIAVGGWHNKRSDWRKGGAWEHEVAFADRLPEHNNSSGLYARYLTSDIVHYSNSRATGWQGFVELLGDVLEHGDGVYRAEVAKILAIYTVVGGEEWHARLVFGVYEAIRYQYPTIPIYVVTDEQMGIVAMREVLISMNIPTIQYH